MLELTTGIPGAYCGRLLAMLGADVVKVESPARADEARAAGNGVDRFLHAQKRSLALDVTTRRGGELMVRLAVGADVVIDDGALGAPGISGSPPWGPNGSQPPAASSVSSLACHPARGPSRPNGEKTTRTSCGAPSSSSS